MIDPTTTMIGLPIFSTINTGSMIACPNTFSVTRRHDHRDDREHQEVDGQAKQVARLHGFLIRAEPGKVAEIEQAEDV